jgi:DNA-binding protein HU-beta
MVKKELVNSISENSGLSKKDSEKALNAFIESVENALANGEKVSLVGFGNFEVRERAERKGRNPISGEGIVIPACKTPVFKASKNLKEKVNG